MFNNDEDLLGIRDNKIYGTYYKNIENNLVVQCSIKDNIYYLMCNNKYMYVNGIDIGLSDELPAKHQRLQFHYTADNTFKVVQWDQNIYLTLKLITSNYSYCRIRCK